MKHSSGTEKGPVSAICVCATNKGQPGEDLGRTNADKRQRFKELDASTHTASSDNEQRSRATSSLDRNTLATKPATECMRDTKGRTMGRLVMMSSLTFGLNVTAHKHRGEQQ